MPRTVTPLVGRAAESARLHDVLDAAANGSAAVLIVGGDAGVGKTRLLAEAQQQATARGMLTMVGHCVDLGDAPPPYLPFSEAFARLRADVPDLAGPLLESHPAIARLLPGGAGHDADERVERGELFAAVLAGLGALAADRPLVLFVEDVHWADRATCDLLGFLFTRLGVEPLALVVSYRSDDLHRRHPLRRTLAEWARLPVVDRLHLDALDTEDVRTLVRAVHGAPLSEPALAGIVSRADGNPFFAEELTTATEHYAGAALPWQLADLLLVRLDRLTDDAREVVRVAAVAGRRVSHDVLAAVADLPPGHLDAALRDALDANILQITSSGRGYTFRHALLAEAVYDDLLPGERIRLHAAYAGVVGDDNPAELARHARASRDYPTAYAASVRAGDAAMVVAAPQEALQHYEAALDLLGRLPEPESGVRLVRKLVDAAVGAGRPGRAVRVARSSLDALPADAPAADRAALLLALASAAVDEEFDDIPLYATGEAIRLTDGERTAFRARVVALHARLHLIAGHEAEARRWADEAVELARSLPGAAASTDAETTLAMLELRSREPAAVAKRLAALADEAQAAGDAPVEIRSRYNVGSLWREHGEIAVAEEAYALAWRRARELGREWMLFGTDARASVARLQFDTGRWDAALRTLDTTSETPPKAARAVLDAAALAVLAGRGDPGLAAAVEALEPFREHDAIIAIAVAGALLEVHGRDGRVDEAETVLAEVVRGFTEVAGDEWFPGRIRMSALALTAVATAARSAPAPRRAELLVAARRHYDDGRATVDHGRSDGKELGVESAAWAARLDAEWAYLCWAAGDADTSADEHIALWQQCVDAFAGISAVELSRCRARLAAVLKAAGRSADAAEQADLARAAATAMGAAPLLADLAAIGTAPARRDAAPTGLASLTEREQEVLGLLVEARTNRQIAQQLFISEKTVSVHVSNILAKLEVRSRAEAAALARAPQA